MRHSLPAGLWSLLVVGLLVVAALPVTAVTALDEPTAVESDSVSQVSATTSTSEPTSTTSEPTPSPTEEPTESPTPESTTTTAPPPDTTTESPTSEPTTSPSPSPSPSPSDSDDGDQSGGSDGSDEDDGSDGDDDSRRGAGKARQLADRLTTSIDATGDGEFQRAQRLVGENYTQTLSTYESLSGKDGAVAGFAGAQSNQQEYIALIREYETTRRQYRTAARHGNESGQQQLSRKLTRLADASNETTARLQQNYSRIEQRTAVSLDDASSTVEAGQRWVAEQQAQVDPPELTRTQLRAGADADRVSFLSPTTVRGTLTAANGSPVANRQVAFTVGGQRVTTTTDGSGGFSFDYRPTTVDRSAERVTLEYVPTETAPYTRATTELPVSIEQTTGDVSVTRSPSNAGFGDELTVRGRVAAADVPAASVPVAVHLGDTTLGTVETGPQGQFSLTTRLPASVTAGDRSLTATLAMEGRALTAESAQAGVSVAKTATSLKLRVANASQQHVFVYGKLTTDEGTAVGGEEIRFSVDETLVGTATTGSNGAYKGNLSLSSDVRDAADSGQVTVRAAYEGQGSPLDASSDAATVSLQANGRAGGSLGDFGGTDGLLLGAAGAAFLLLLLFAAWGILRFGAAGAADDEERDADGAGDADGGREQGTDDLTTATTRESVAATDENAATAAATDASTSTADASPGAGNQFSWSEVEDGESESPTGDSRAASRPSVTFDDASLDSTVSEADDPTEPSEPAPPGDETAVDGTVAGSSRALSAARTALADGEYQTAVDRAYGAAREYVQTRYDFDAVDSLSASSSPETFYETCTSHGDIDDDLLGHFDELTQLQDRALYGYGSVSNEEAERAVSHAAAVVDDDSGTSP